jgi:hypothetical protein
MRENPAIGRIDDLEGSPRMSGLPSATDEKFSGALRERARLGM